MIIEKNNAEMGTNNPICQTIEYSFDDKDIDLGIATIKGRYPKDGYCLNTVSKELIYVLDGSGKIYFKNKEISFSEGDAILILNNEPYYWETSYCKVAMTCTPAWNKEQYKIIKQ